MIDAYLSLNIAVVLLILGKSLTSRVALLRDYAIPEPVVGGFVCVAVVALIYALTGREISFELGLRDYLLLIFFAGIGLKSDIATLREGGRPLAVLLGLASVFLVAQNLLGVAMAALFGQEPLMGLMLGSISLTGGVGTTLAWAPIFAERGLVGALELGLAANTVGLIAACVIGGPVAAYLIRRHGLRAEEAGALDLGARHEAPNPPLDYFAVLGALLVLNVTVLLGGMLHEAISALGITLPQFVSCLIAGIVLGNTPLGGLVARLAGHGKRLRKTQDARLERALALLSDIALGLFLTMALMGLQLWTLSGVFAFIASTLALQVAMTLAFTIWVVFRFMGRDYEAAVIGAGFGGISLGSTATAIANMTAVAQRHGPAHRAFVIVPLVAGFFIDLLNALVISAFLAL